MLPLSHLRLGIWISFVVTSIAAPPPPPDVKSLAYTSLVRPILEYGTAAWDPYRAKDINKLDMVQRRAARFVRRDYRQTTSVLSLLDQLGWPSLSDRRLNNRLKIFGKTVAGRVALDTGDLAQPLRQTRYSNLDLSFTALAARTDVYKHSFFEEQYVIGTP